MHISVFPFIYKPHFIIKLSKKMDHEYYPGFRFFPVEEELITFYLHNKLQGTRPDIDRVIPLLDIYDHVPSHLPQLAGERCRGETEQWFFFVPMQDREARGGRPNRLTNEGYWKATGSPGYVYSSQNRVIGVKRTMVFYQGRAPNGHKTPWKMNEYRATEPQDPSSNPPKVRQELSLCRVYNGSKSIRAFDRRPPPAAATSSSAAPPHLNPSSIPDHREVITSSSSSGEDAPPPPPPPQAMDTGDDQNFTDVNFQNVPMWDFEEQFKYW